MLALPRLKTRAAFPRLNAWFPVPALATVPKPRVRSASRPLGVWGGQCTAPVHLRQDPSGPGRRPLRRGCRASSPRLNQSSGSGRREERGRRGARAHAQSGPAAPPGRGVDKSRPSPASEPGFLPPGALRLLEAVWGPAGAEPAFLGVVGGPPRMRCLPPPARSATVAPRCSALQRVIRTRTRRDALPGVARRSPVPTANHQAPRGLRHLPCRGREGAGCGMAQGNAYRAVRAPADEKLGGHGCTLAPRKPALGLPSRSAHTGT